MDEALHSFDAAERVGWYFLFLARVARFFLTTDVAWGVYLEKKKGLGLVTGVTQEVILSCGNIQRTLWYLGKTLL